MSKELGMALVVRCPGCRDASVIDPAARGQSVRCPQCGTMFTAVPEAQLVLPGRSRRQATPPSERDLEEFEGEISPRGYSGPDSHRDSGNDRDEPHVRNEGNHDPHDRPPGGLPASVLIGLALLPFAIPILWLLAPIALGQAPLLSAAVPLAIALSASILSLSVIYTIDWSPGLRVKGVLMLVGLSYFISLSLYFLKKEMVDWVRTTFNHKEWIRFTPHNAGSLYTVRLPRAPIKNHDQPIPGVALDCYKLNHTDETGSFTFFVASGESRGAQKEPELGSDKWYDETVNRIIEGSKGQRDATEPVERVRVPAPLARQERFGRQFVVKRPDGSIQIVQLFANDGSVYYLSIEGTELTLKDANVSRFFNSFEIIAAKK